MGWTLGRLTRGVVGFCRKKDKMIAIRQKKSIPVLMKLKKKKGVENLKDS